MWVTLSLSLVVNVIHGLWGFAIQFFPIETSSLSESGFSGVTVILGAHSMLINTQLK